MSTWPKQIAMTRHGAVQRAIDMSNVKPTRYKLGAGGRNPTAEAPFTTSDGILGSDCVGFTNWCCGIDRYQPHAKGGMIEDYAGWINCDSAMGDARGPRLFFEFTDSPQPGDMVVFPSIVKNGSRSSSKGGRHGHIALIVEVDIDTSHWTGNLWKRPYHERKNFLRHLHVIDCAASTWRRVMGRAIQQVTAATSWNKPDARFLRYRHFSDEATQAA